jgi:hypothetical protein
MRQGGLVERHTPADEVQLLPAQRVRNPVRLVVPADLDRLGRPGPAESERDVVQVRVQVKRHAVAVGDHKLSPAARKLRVVVHLVLVQEQERGPKRRGVDERAQWLRDRHGAHPAAPPAAATTAARTSPPALEGGAWSPCRRWWLRCRRVQRVVPLAVELMAHQRHRRQLLLAHLDAKRIVAAVQLRADPQARAGCGRRNQLEITSWLTSGRPRQFVPNPGRLTWTDMRVRPAGFHSDQPARNASLGDHPPSLLHLHRRGVRRMVVGSTLTFRLRSDDRRSRSRQARRRRAGPVATTLATQTLLPGTTGRLWMESVPYLSSQDGPGRVQLEGFGPTRNRKVVGSNPTSGSKAQVSALLCSPC